MKWGVFFFLMIGGAFGYTADDGAKTILTDGSQSDTQAAVTYVDGKNEDGWVMTVGSAGGSYTWTSAVNMAATFVHSFVIEGAGGSGNRTTLTANFTSGGQALGLRATPGKLTKAQYFIFTTQDANTLGSGFVCVDQTSTSDASNAFWVQYCTFTNCNPYAMTVLGPNRASAGAVYGLINNCTFTTPDGHNALYFYVGNSQDQWTKSMTWGTVDTICIEDCTFTGPADTVEGKPAIDSAYNGVRWLARYSTFANWVLVAHGADSAPSSTLQVEIYNNTITVDNATDYAVYIRGGALMMTDNTIGVTGAGSYNSVLKFAQDSDPADFQQVGDGAVAGVETIVGAYMWNNTLSDYTTLVSNAGTLAQNVNWFLTAPAPGLPTESYTKLVYPHPLRGSAGGGSSISGTGGLAGKATLQ